MFPVDVAYGDGTPIETEVINAIRKAPPPLYPAHPHAYTRTRTHMPARTVSLTHADADGADWSGVCGALCLHKPFA